MKKGRSIWVALRLAFVCSILAILPSMTHAAGSQICPFHHACPDDQYDCCCRKGVRCDLSQYECEEWCKP